MEGQQREGAAAAPVEDNPDVGAPSRRRAGSDQLAMQANRGVPKVAPVRKPSSLWQRLLEAPDPDLVDAGQRGEWMIAGIRVLIVLVVLYPALDQFLQSPLEESRRLVMWVAVAALAEALVVYSAVMRSWGRGWIGFFSGLLDVSLVTLSLWIFIRLDQPLMAIGDLVIFPVYLLAIGATSLRYDWRICLLTGVTAICEYVLLVTFAVWRWDLLDPTTTFGSGFSLNAQVGRVLLLVMSTGLATTLVVRAREQRRLSTRDRLTDLANRGFFDESMMRMGALASRSGESVGVAMIDVDHFKRFNDTWGHLAGDKALQMVAEALAQSFRTTDLIARYGGEEFSGLFPGLSMEGAERRLDAIRAKIESMEIPVGNGGEKTRVTVSMGVAVWPEDGINLSETLAIADLRLYQAKQKGRNQVVGAPQREGRGDGPGAVSEESQEKTHASL